MKTIRILQKLANIGRIISKIVFICCLVGGICCTVGLACLPVFRESFSLFGVKFHPLAEGAEGINLYTAYTAMGVALFCCSAECVVSKMANRYFTHELAAGTPFTRDGAAEMMQLGITMIWVPMAAVIASAILVGIMTQTFGLTRTFELDRYESIGMGIMFIVMSLVCRSGAEMLEERKIEQ